jgi:hypothetical protein
MADTGCYARRMFDLIEPKQRQRLHWCRTSPVTSNESYLSFFCPTSPLFAQYGRRRVADLCAPMQGSRRARLISGDFLEAVPPWKRLRNGRWGRENGSVGHLLSVGLMNQAHLSAGLSASYSSSMLPMKVLSLFNMLISRVTTPVPMGAIFRNEGGSSTSSLPRMEEGTQGVTPSFNEEVAWGSGWFPLYVTGGYRSVHEPASIASVCDVGGDGYVF